MDRLREGANSLVIKIILSIIVVSFVFAGVGSYLHTGSDSYAAKVDGNKISLNQLEHAVQQERNQMQNSQYGRQVAALFSNPDYVKLFKLNVLRRLINEKLLTAEIGKLGLTASDVQIKENILTTPQFSPKGEFNNELYLETLRRIGYTPDLYAETLRHDIAKQQLLDAIVATQFALPSEIDKLAILDTQKRVVQSHKLNLAKFKQQAAKKLTPKEIQEYYAAHNSSFMQPEQLKLAYIVLDINNVAKKVKITPTKLKDFLAKNRDKFTSIKDPKLVSQYKQEQAESLFYKLQKTLVDKSFEIPDTLEDAAQATGLAIVETDFISKETAPKILANAKVFAAANDEEVKEQGMNSEAIELAENKIMLLRVQDVKPATLKELSQVKSQIKGILVAQKALNLAQLEAQSIIEKLKNGKTKTVKFTKRITLARNYKDISLAQYVFSMPQPKNNKPSYGYLTNKDGSVILVKLDKVITGKVAPKQDMNRFRAALANMLGKEDLELSIRLLQSQFEVEMPQQLEQE